MSLPIKTGLPGDHTLHNKYVVRFTATDPTTGDLVAGVKVSQIAVFGEVQQQDQSVPTGPVILVPQG